MVNVGPAGGGGRAPGTGSVPGVPGLSDTAPLGMTLGMSKARRRG